MTGGRKYFKWFLIIIVLPALIYFSGPKPAKPELNTTIPKVNGNLEQLEKSINQSEAAIKFLDPENRARIIWADSTHKSKTRYSVVYLHGFSGTWTDGSPVNIEFAKRYGFNLYLSRLHSHGIVNENPLLDLTPENYLESAARAIAIGKALGDSVIIMGTSTGGTLGLILAKDHPEIAALILYSPNIDLFNKLSFILTMPWGLQISRLIQAGKFRSLNDPPELRKYWFQKYRIEALVTLKSLIQNTMNRETFSKVKQPLLMGYYYRNEEEQDSTTSVKRELEMFSELGTPEALKRKINFPNAGVHPIACGLMSGDINGVLKETFDFAETVLKLKPVIKK